jgi:nucleoside-diphosphate-sugar epimerase
LEVELEKQLGEVYLKVLVTGGSGFIGTNIVAELLRRGHRVRILDRRVPKVSGAEWVDGDLRWLGDCDRAVRGVDAVMHLAARISVDESIDYIWQYYNDNLISTVNIFVASRKYEVNHIVFTSSCEVYGETPPQGATEESPCNPTSPYAASKYAAERAALSFKNIYPELKLAILRPFNTFGEWQKPFRAGAVIPTFILQALRNQPITVHGTGGQVRDFVYAGDIARVQVDVLEKGLEGIFNIASGRARTINEIAHSVVKLIGKGKVEHIEDMRKGAQLFYSLGDSTKLTKLTGWKPTEDFEPALKKVIDWYTSRPEFLI